MPESSRRPVFVSYSRDDIERVAPLVDALADEGLSVFWDENIGGGQRWRMVIPDAISKSAAVVVLWTQSSVTRKYVLEEATEAQQTCVLVSVKFEGGVEMPFGFREEQYIDLSGWGGERSPEFNELLTRLRFLVERSRAGSHGHGPPWDEHSFGAATSATTELQQLVGTVRELGGQRSRSSCRRRWRAGRSTARRIFDSRTAASIRRSRAASATVPGF